MTKQQRMNFSVAELCRCYGLSRQAFYQHQARSRQRTASQDKVLKLVQEERAQQPRLGGRKLYHLIKAKLQQLGIKLGRDKLFGLLREKGLLIQSKRKYCITTNSKHPFKRYDNQFKQLSLSAPHQAWVADITYIRTLAGFRYLALITDAYSRKIVGYDLSDSLCIEGSLRALKIALKQLPQDSFGLVHHSDRGVQYCAYAYTDILNEHHFTISMAEAANVYENAMAERVNGILKLEYALDQTFSSDWLAHKAVTEAIYLYNHKRPHLALNYQTPQQVHVSFSQSVSLANCA
jgi:transposase InsO family protein